MLNPPAVRHPLRLLCVILFVGTPVTASLESGINAFESRQWSKALQDFLLILQEDPSHPEAHAYITLSSRHMEEDRQSVLRQERMALLSSAAKLTERDSHSAETLSNVLSETSEAAGKAREDRWHTLCLEARAHRLSGRLMVAHELVLGVLSENASFAEAQRELSELQSKVRELLDRGAGATIEERYALEGFYAYGQADYESAIRLWTKLRIFLEQNSTPQDMNRRIQSMRFAAFESIAKARVADAERLSRLRELFAEGIRLVEKRRWENALDTFRKVAIQEPDYPELGIYLVRTEAAIEQERAERLGAHKQEEVERLLNEGRKALEKQSLAEAEQRFERVVQMDPSHAAAQSYLQMTRAELKRLHDPQAAQMHYETGLVAYASGKLDEAVREWRMTTRMNPQHAKARLALGKAQKELAMNNEKEDRDETLP